MFVDSALLFVHVSVRPKPLESICGQFGVPHRVLDVPMAEVVLDRSGVVSLVRELEAAGVAQHMRVNRESELGLITGPGNDLAN